MSETLVPDGKCRTCKWWAATDAPDRIGQFSRNECRASGPVAADRRNFGEAQWPITRMSDFCKEYEYVGDDQ